MLREHRYVRTRLAGATDLLLAMLAVLAAHWFRNSVLAPWVLPELLDRPSALSDYAYLFVIVPPLFVVCLAWHGAYSATRLRRSDVPWSAGVFASAETAAVVLAGSMIFGPERLSGFTGFDTQASALSRAIILQLPLWLTAIWFLRCAAIAFLAQRGALPGPEERLIIVVGEPASIGWFENNLTAQLPESHRMVGAVCDIPKEQTAAKFAAPPLGQLDQLPMILRNHAVDEVWFLADTRPLAELTPHLEVCEEMGLRTRVVLSSYQPGIAKPAFDLLRRTPIVSFSPVAEMSMALFIKAAMDRCVSLVLLLLFAPLMFLIAALIKMTSKSWSDPIFFGQVRSGLNGRTFTLYKFRSMFPDAEARLEQLRADNEMSGPVFKIKSDPRITGIGRVLRKTSLDELPQLWNVLRGEMSLVGPRPPLPAEVERYDRWQRRRLSMRPGITCLWQVSGRNHLSFEEWMRLDLEYIDNWSLMLDLKILVRTVYVVATGYGAM